MENFVNIFRHSIMITGFVFIMMLVIEYANVQTNGLWQKNLSKNRWFQYLFGAFLGAIPGCLGAFTAVALFSHRVISFGALVTTMIATSGDEAFVMFAQMPQKALLLTIIIFFIGIIAGYLSDKLLNVKAINKKFENFKFSLHKEEPCVCFTLKQLIYDLKHLSMQRGLLILLVGIILFGSLMGSIGPKTWNWVRVTLCISSLIAMFIVFTVPEHFLEEHLWNHIVRKHIPRIFLWTFGTLFVVHFFMQYMDINSWIADNVWIVLIVAVLIGIIPESGPHMIFITLYVAGTIPFSILLASSIVQDGHGMIPLLAESKRAFFSIKLLNVIVGLITGIIGILIGF